MTVDEKKFYLVLSGWTEVLSFNAGTQRQEHHCWRCDWAGWMFTEDAFRLQQDRDVGKIQW